MKEIKLIEVLKVKFEKKKQGNKIKNKTAYFNSNPFTITNENDIEQLNSWRTVSEYCQNTKQLRVYHSSHCCKN